LWRPLENLANTDKRIWWQLNESKQSEKEKLTGKMKLGCTPATHWKNQAEPKYGGATKTDEREKKSSSKSERGETRRADLVAYLIRVQER
jgi:hypothetical protein